MKSIKKIPLGVYLALPILVGLVFIAFFIFMALSLVGVSIDLKADDFFAIHYDVYDSQYGDVLEINLYGTPLAKSEIYKEVELHKEIKLGDVMGVSLEEVGRSYLSTKGPNGGVRYYCYTRTPSYTDHVWDSFWRYERSVYRTSILLDDEQIVDKKEYTDASGKVSKDMLGQYCFDIIR